MAGRQPFRIGRAVNPVPTTETRPELAEPDCRFGTCRQESGEITQMADRKLIYLHIGWEKTGTSSIQSFLGRNTKWLRRHDMMYPKMGTRFVQHLDMYRALASSNPRRIAGMVNGVRDLVQRADERNIIFSHETLHYCNPAMFSCMFDDCDVRVIAYLRRPDLAIISRFVTRIRFGAHPTKSFRKTLRKFGRDVMKFADYYWQLKNFALLFGYENIVLRHFDPKTLYEGNSVSDFMHVLGIENLKGSKWPDARSNPSMDVDQLAFVFELGGLLTNLNQMQLRRHTRTICDVLLDRTTSDPQRSVGRFVSARAKRRILNRFAPSNDLLNREFLGGREMFKPVEDDDDDGESSRYPGLDEERRSRYMSALLKDGRIPKALKKVLRRKCKVEIVREAVTQPAL